ncbi:MAG: hypothetical protein CMQ54_00115 [Gammaproteobacteria bacterium]|nr:hypothetical protein [Gammaproteobacteria bacterium]
MAYIEEIFMLKKHRYNLLSCIIFIFFLINFFNFDSVFANQDSNSTVNAHLFQVKRALDSDDYSVAATQYRKAAKSSDSIEIAQMAIRFGLTYGFHEEALLSAKHWLKLDGGSKEVRFILGQIYFRINKLKKSKSNFQKYLKMSSKVPTENLLPLANYLSKEGYPKRADRLMRLLAKPYLKSASAQYAVAFLALQAGEIKYAKKQLIRSLKLKPDFHQSKFLYAKALMFEGKANEAISYLEYFIGDSSQPNPDARIELANLYIMVNRDEDALGQINQVLIEQNGREDALQLMGIIYYRSNQFNAAWENFQDLLVSANYRMDALFYLARISHHRKQYVRAIRLYSQVNFGENAKLSHREASFLLAYQLNDSEGAFILLEEFKKKSPIYAVDALMLKAQLLSSLKRYEEAILLYNQLIKFRPENQYLFFMYAKTMVLAGQIDKSVTAYRAAVKRWPNNPEMLNALGYTLANNNERFAESERFIRKALKLDPDNPAIIDSLGWILFKTGRYNEALNELRRAYLRLKDPEVVSHIIEVLVVLEQYNEAYQILKYAENSLPTSELIKDVRKRYFTESP